MSPDKETLAFQAESKMLLELMTNSIYSNKEIFLRELISNASDALDRLRFEALTDDSIKVGEPAIRIRVDDKERILIVEDNGIGMSRDEVIDNIGTIAKSGSRELMARLKELKSKQDSGAGLPEELIGQFGVGFYSVFMVADKVSFQTQRAGSGQATLWQSEGAGEYSVEECQCDWEGPGTRVTLHLKRPDEDDGLADFTSTWKLRSIVKQYSDFVRYPVMLQVTREEKPEGDEQAEAKQITEWETLNSMKAIWLRPANEVSEDEHKEFYRHITHDWGEPLTHISMKAEGMLEYNALLYIPSKAPFDLFYQGYKAGLKLYVKNVLIMDDCEELLPPWLRFVKGVVDSPDLSLNISREILQQNRQISAIRKNLTRKVLDHLAGLKTDEPESYLRFWEQFGRALKEGLASGPQDKDRLVPLLLFQSSHHESQPCSLADYVTRMPEGQSAIYYLSGESRVVLENSPHLEAYREKGYEVLYLTDPIDELMLPFLTEFEDKPLKSVGKGEADVSETDKQALEAEQKSLAGLLELIKTKLSGKVSEVRLTARLSSSPACLVVEENGVSPHLERLLRHSEAAAGMPNQERILELNPKHDLLSKLNRMYIANDKDPRLTDYTELLHGQALLAEGSPLPDPARFTRLLTDIMLRAE